MQQIRIGNVPIPSLEWRKSRPMEIENFLLSEGKILPSNGKQKLKSEISPDGVEQTIIHFKKDRTRLLYGSDFNDALKLDRRNGYWMMGLNSRFVHGFFKKIIPHVRRLNKQKCMKIDKFMYKKPFDVFKTHDFESGNRKMNIVGSGFHRSDVTVYVLHDFAMKCENLLLMLKHKRLLQAELMLNYYSGQTPFHIFNGN